MQLYTMYDSANPLAIPLNNVDTVAGYINANYTWSNAEFGRWPNAVKVLIAVELDQWGLWKHANVFDIENGALTPQQARYAIEYRQSSRMPGNAVYCSLSNRAMVEKVMHGMHYYEWIADWTGIPHIVPGAAGTQYESNNQWDKSLITEEWRAALNKANRPWPLA